MAIQTIKRENVNFYPQIHIVRIHFSSWIPKTIAACVTMLTAEGGRSAGECGQRSGHSCVVNCVYAQQ